MNLLKFECRNYVPSSFIWAISLSFFGSLCIGLFTTFSKDVEFFQTMLSAYSPEILKAFGAELSVIESLQGFYGFCFMYVALCAAFQAIYLGIVVVGKEHSGKTADFLYTKPISRSNVLTNKLMSVTLCIVIVNIIYSITTYLMALSTGLSFDLTIFFSINLSLFLTQILFLSLGFCLGCIMKKIKSPLSLASGITCIFFLLEMVVNLESDGILSYISFLNYVSADSILANQGFEMVKLSLLIILSIGFIGVGYRVFTHKDIHTA